MPRSVYGALSHVVLLSLAASAVLAAEPRHDLPVHAKDLQVLPGFHAERLYLVPRSQGSWVSMAFDPQGRITVSHEGGGLYRVTPSPLGESRQPTQVEKLDVKIGGAQGLLFAFDSLYAIAGGVIRLRDTNGDGQFDSVRKLLTIRGRGEHGPHAIVLGPEKKWLYVVAGNATPLSGPFDRDHVASWAGAKNHSPPGPQGWVMRIDSEANTRELYCVGLRNSYGLALNNDGELFTFDSDNEGFMNLPWYRPTNVFHLVSGADFGWRQSSRNLQTFHPDNLPPVLEVGPGSPTGMVFGRGAKFPEKYQRALFVNDWSYGRIYAIHLRPHGASYRADQEFFASGRPLAVTDVRIGPDGAMYFLTGGRGTQSALYRISWQGTAVDAKLPGAAKSSADESADDKEFIEARRLRRQLERFHGRTDRRAVEEAWPQLRNSDRSIRYAARVAIEHQPFETWRERAFQETNVRALLEAMIAVARQGDRSLRSRMLTKLTALDWQRLTAPQRLALLRVYELAFERLEVPDADEAKPIIAQLDRHYPNADDDVNRELIKLLVDLRASRLLPRTITVLERTPTAMRQLHFLLQMKRANGTWSDEQRKRMIATLDLETLRDTAGSTYKDVSSMMTSLLKDMGVAAKPEEPPAPRKLVKKWKMNQVAPLIESRHLSRANLQNGRSVFRKALCHNCHRVGNTGGVLGPNLTSLSARYQPQAVLESIVEPDKVISDQYRTTVFRTTAGKQFTGQIVNLSKGVIQIRLDPLRPFPRVSFKESDIEDIRPAKTSLMPTGLLDYLTADEIRDLMAYLLEPR